MFDENRKFSLREVAYLCAMTIKEAEEEVCDCNEAFGYVCEYHKDPNIKHTLQEWQKISTNIYHTTVFFPVNDIEDYPKTKKLEK